MYVVLLSPQKPDVQHFVLRWVLVFAFTWLLALLGSVCYAAPVAGTVISNQGSASFTDGTGVFRTVNSNRVRTTVTAVYSSTLTATPQSKTVVAGGNFVFSHTVTNTGNSTEYFKIVTGAAGLAGAIPSLGIYIDDGNGNPVGASLVTDAYSGSVNWQLAPRLAPGQSLKILLIGTVSTTATAGTSSLVTISSNPNVFSGAVLGPVQSNSDTITVGTGAVVSLKKEISALAGIPGSGPYTYRLNYINSGSAGATTVIVNDAIPAGMRYISGSARWSESGATPLSESGGTTVSSSVGPASNLVSSYTVGNNTFVATLDQVGAGREGKITFNVMVDAAAPSGVQTNIASLSYKNGASTLADVSNPVGFTVIPATIASLTFVGPVAPVDSAGSGQTVSFTNILKNTGPSTDTFNITYDAGSFPANTVFQLLGADGLTPLLDTNGDNTIDTGPVAAGAVYNVVLKASLPFVASIPSGPFIATVKAISTLSAAVTATATDTLTAIIPAAVDLTNTSAAGTGTGPGPEGAAVLTTTASTSAPAVFTLVASNKGASPDNYDLAASNVSSFASIALPAGWSVSFKADGGAGNCSTTGANITNTGTVLAGASFAYCAVVTVPATGAGAAAGTTPLYFRLLSPNTGAKDIITDAVKIDVIRSLILTPTAQAAQVLAGGSTVYVHTLVNAGNVTEGGGTTSSSISLAAVNAQAGWTSALYIDTNANGVLDVADTQITGNLDTVLTATGLVPGATRTIFNKVTSSAGATAGALDTSTITLTVSAGVNGTAPAPVIAVDTSTVVSGNLTVVKSSVLDPLCDGTPTAYSAAVVSAKPGQCILYKITVTNISSQALASVVVGDATPTFTRMSQAPSVTIGSMAVGAPAVGALGAFSANVGNLFPYQIAVMTFGVKVDQ